MLVHLPEALAKKLTDREQRYLVAVSLATGKVTIRLPIVEMLVQFLAGFAMNNCSSHEYNLTSRPKHFNEAELIHNGTSGKYR